MGIRNLKGQKFGRLTVMSLDSTKNGCAMWKCVCECGAHRVVRSNCLTTGNTVSCGCLNNERRRSPKTHGLARTRAYRVWTDMMQRCNNPRNKAYKYYGGRGITVHPWWHTFINFYVDMGEPPTGMELDRIKNHLGYVPGNCRWATSQQNSMNTGKHKPTASRFKGVSAKGKRWGACIKHNRRGIYIGVFDTEEEAASAYDVKARELFGEFACCNFEESNGAS